MDWLHDDGINLSMINDHVRNQFYQDMIMDVVRNRRCIDVGFGTGLLTMMALRHGAIHVTAYEQDPQRYHLGLQIIERCGVQNKVTLLNQNYNHQLRGDKNTVIFHEIMSHNIWSEGLWGCLPRESDSNFFPAFYQVEIKSFSLPTVQSGPLFDPKVEIDESFVEIINQHISQHVTCDRYNFYQSQRYNEYYIKCLTQKLDCDFVGGYRWNVDTCDITYLGSDPIHKFDQNEEYIAIPIDVAAPSLIVVRAGFGYQNKILYYGQTWDWPDLAAEPYVNFHEKLTFNHNFINGEIRFFPRQY